MLISLLLAAITYGSPVNYEIALAGNFAEPRYNHFHGGIDVKTGGVEGKPIFSIGDGYVSCVTVGLGGYGNAIYVHHPEGYTSVYCHLKAFTPQIQAMVRKWQYAHKSYRGEMHFKPTDIPIARGQLIAISGNSGSSQAPHLHLEIHDTRTWDMVDPLNFLGVHVSDGYAPLAHGFMAYPMKDEGSFCGGFAKQSYGFGAHNLTRKFYAWGKVGFGLWANDYMEITYNRYGVKTVQLLVDGKEVFRSVADNIPIAGNMLVNSWGDYNHFLHYGVWYMRSFVKPGNTLTVYTAVNNGVVDFNEERDYHLTYLLTDFKGNQSKYTFAVEGRRTAIPKSLAIPRGKVLRYDRMNNTQLPGMTLITQPFSVDENQVLQPVVKRQPQGLSDSYRLADGSFPLLRYGKLSLRLNRQVVDSSKLYVESNWGGKRYLAGVYDNGWVTASVRELGATYQLAYDDQPPTVNPVSLGTVLTIGMADTGSGVAGCEAYLDGRFVLFEDVPKSPWVRCNLRDTPIKPIGKSRRLVFIARDKVGNKRIYKTQIKY